MKILISEKTTESTLEKVLLKISQKELFSSTELGLIRHTIFDFLNILKKSEGLSVFLEKTFKNADEKKLKVLAKPFRQMSFFEKFFSL